MIKKLIKLIKNLTLIRHKLNKKGGDSMLEILETRLAELEEELAKSAFTPEDERFVNVKVDEYRQNLIKEIKEDKSKNAEILKAKIDEIHSLIKSVKAIPIEENVEEDVEEVVEEQPEEQPEQHSINPLL